MARAIHVVNEMPIPGPLRLRTVQAIAWDIDQFILTDCIRLALKQQTSGTDFCIDIMSEVGKYNEFAERSCREHDNLLPCYDCYVRESQI